MPLKLDRYAIYLPAPTDEDPDAHVERHITIKHVDRLTAEKVGPALGIRAADSDGNALQPVAYMTLNMWAAAKRLGFTDLGPKKFIEELIDFDPIKDDVDDLGQEQPDPEADPTQPAAPTD